MKNFLFISLLLAFFTSSVLVNAQDSKNNSSESLKYTTGKGLTFHSNDDKLSMNIRWRAQVRYSTDYKSDPRKASDFDKNQNSAWINRGRMKIGGHAYLPALTYYLEYDLPSSRLLDMRVMYKFSKHLNIKAGQGKLSYTQERFISSGKQQTMERSIINREFTLDRQAGLSIFGNIGYDNPLNFNYWVGAYTGQGRGEKENDDDKLLYMGRLQWNFMGKPMKFTGSDLKMTEKFIGMFAFAAATNQSSFNRYSSNGGEYIDYEEGKFGSSGAPGQYRINQCVQETAGKYKGFSWQQELHWKQVRDIHNETAVEMMGGLFQAGYMLNGIFPKLKDQIEIYGRTAVFYPQTKEITNSSDYSELSSTKIDISNANTSYRNEELTVGFNYFFSGHSFKITTEAGYYNVDTPVVVEVDGSTGGLTEGWRFRTQLEITF